MFRIISDPMFQQALLIALFHPLNNNGRLKLLLLGDDISEHHLDESPFKSTDDINYIRVNLVEIIENSNSDSNLAILGCVLLNNISIARNKLIVDLEEQFLVNEDDANISSESIKAEKISKHNILDEKIDLYIQQSIITFEWSYAKSDSKSKLTEPDKESVEVNTCSGNGSETEDSVNFSCRLRFPFRTNKPALTVDGININDSSEEIDGYILSLNQLMELHQRVIKIPMTIPFISESLFQLLHEGAHPLTLFQVSYCYIDA